MTIITISRGSFSRGKQIAEIVAEQLGYQCLAREIVLEASEQFNLPEIKLVRAIHDSPSILERLGFTKEKYLSSFKKTFLQQMLNDNIVYHGLAGHLLLRGISHVLKVRIVSDFIERVQLEMERMQISREEALHILRRDDEERRKWSLHLYGVDTADPHLYDLVINIKHLTPEDAAEIICSTARLARFRTTPESRKALQDQLDRA